LYIVVASQHEPSSIPLLEVRDLVVRFGRHLVLRDINLQIMRGETVAIVGESGCGKTVLLKTMIGLVRPSAGHVRFDARDLSELSEKDVTQQRARLGFVFQNAALFDSMTIGQNVAFPLREHTNWTMTRIQEVVIASLADVGLPEMVAPKKPAELSGGMRKRVGLARALVLNPELVFYDEPTTGLDPIMADVINELMMQVRLSRGVTSVIVTHDLRTVRKVADRVVMLFPLQRLTPDEPQVIFDGPPSELERCEDHRVVQFARGEAGERLMELREQGSGAMLWTNES
jgi:phospholipid/cholesterol/gamma-HCH transport system ATP-binding protein